MNKNDIVTARKILTLFTQLGYKKTTMQDIANAAGLSRQSMYKKFGSKENCYTWTIEIYLADIYTRVFESLNSENITPLKTLKEVFDIFIGEAIEIANHSYRTGVFDDVIKATYSSEEDWHVRFTNRLANFLEKNNCVPSEKAQGIAMTLILASKGLLLVETSNEQFKIDMEIILKSVINFD